MLTSPHLSGQWPALAEMLNMEEQKQMHNKPLSNTMMIIERHRGNVTIFFKDEQLVGFRQLATLYPRHMETDQA